MSTIESEHFNKALLGLLDETFDRARGYYIDGGDSLFETLADISVDEASIPVGGKCATLAAQLKHLAFYLDYVDKSARDPAYPAADWGEIWRTVSSVTPDEWDAIRAELRANYNRVIKLIEETPSWSSEAQIGEAIAIVAHCAYHLGEVRQALCTLKP